MRAWLETVRSYWQYSSLTELANKNAFKIIGCIKKSTHATRVGGGASASRTASAPGPGDGQESQVVLHVHRFHVPPQIIFRAAQQGLGLLGPGLGHVAA